MQEKELLDKAMEELEGAKHYAKCAMKYRDSDPAKSKRYYDMAQDELRHADNLYRMAGQETEKHTALETAFLDEQRDSYAEMGGKIKAMLDMYRGT